MNARVLTGASLAEALRKALDPAISRSLRRNAERLRAALDEAPLPGGEIGPAPVRSGNSLDVAIAHENLFAREFGTLAAPADPVIAPAIDRLKRRSR